MCVLQAHVLHYIFQSDENPNLNDFENYLAQTGENNLIFEFYVYFRKFGDFKLPPGEVLSIKKAKSVRL